MSTTPGPSGGHAGLNQLRELLEWLGMTVISTQLGIHFSAKAFDAEGRLVRKEDVSALALWAEQLVCATLPTTSVTGTAKTKEA